MEDALTETDGFALRPADPHTLSEWVRVQYEEMGSGLHRYLVRMTGDAGHAEDLVQETFLRLYVEILQRRNVKNLRSWLFQVGHNLAVDYLRRRGQEAWMTSEGCQEERCDDAPNAEAALLHAERQRQVRRGLRLLTPQERQVVELRAEGLRYKEIAELMELQVSTVATFLTRALQKIARQIHG